MIVELALLPSIALAIVGAGIDIWKRLLPNTLCLALAVSGVGAVYLMHGAELVLYGAGHALVALIIGMALFKFGVIGGGDAKFYAAAALSVPGYPMAGPLALLGWTGACGLVLVLAMLIARVFRSGASRSGLLRGWSVPYGVAIAAGYCLSHLSSGLNV